MHSLVLIGFACLAGFAVWALAGMLLRNCRYRGTPAV
jgi:hypothetical protein